jgi:hypothetical protein
MIASLPKGLGLNPSSPSAPTVAAILEELLSAGYTLSASIRTEVYDHKGVGSQAITYADRLEVRGGPGELPDELRDGIAAHRDELLAAACILNPPVGWIAGAVRRLREGVRTENARQVPYKKRDGSVALKNARVAVAVTPDSLAANLAVFMSYAAVHDADRLLPGVVAALAALGGRDIRRTAGGGE